VAAFSPSEPWKHAASSATRKCDAHQPIAELDPTAQAGRFSTQERGRPVREGRLWAADALRVGCVRAIEGLFAPVILLDGVFNIRESA